MVTVVVEVVSSTVEHASGVRARKDSRRPQRQSRAPHRRRIARAAAQAQAAPVAAACARAARCTEHSGRSAAPVGLPRDNPGSGHRSPCDNNRGESGPAHGATHARACGGTARTLLGLLEGLLQLVELGDVTEHGDCLRLRNRMPTNICRFFLFCCHEHLSIFYFFGE